MDLSELHRVKRQERSTDSLQELRESFYEDVAAYINSLREERSEAAAEAEDPFRSATVSDLTSEIETAEYVAEAIYQRRIGKLVDEASLAATGNGSRTTGLTAEEKALYEDLVDRISENKTAVLGRFSGNSDSDDRAADSVFDGSDTPDSSSPGTNESEPREAHPPDQPLEESGPSPAAAMGGELDAEEQSRDDGDEDDTAAESTVERTTVRMTADVGEIFGVDAESYDLKQDDVVDLPSENADPLLERDVAERVE